MPPESLKVEIKESLVQYLNIFQARMSIEISHSKIMQKWSDQQNLHVQFSMCYLSVRGRRDREDLGIKD